MINYPFRSGSLVIEPGGRFSESEMSSAQFVSELGYNVELRMPRGTRSGGQTSDLLVDGVPYDVYTPTTTKADNIIVAIRRKNTQAHGIVLDLSKTSVQARELRNVMKRLQGTGGTNIKDIIVKGGR